MKTQEAIAQEEERLFEAAACAEARELEKRWCDRVLPGVALEAAGDYIGNMDAATKQFRCHSVGNELCVGDILSDAETAHYMVPAMRQVEEEEMTRAKPNDFAKKPLHVASGAKRGDSLLTYCDNPTENVSNIAFRNDVPAHGYCARCRSAYKRTLKGR